MKKRMVASFLMIVMVIAILPANVAQAATYQKGSKGIKVEYLQRNLTFLGFSTNGTDGDFGNNTRNAVLGLQKTLGFAQTGTVDDELYNFIQNTVADIQRYLKEKGYYTGVIDGISGNGTINALKSFQKDIKSVYQGYTDYFTLKKIVDDTGVKAETKNVREWVARLNGTYWKTLNSYYYNIFGEDYLTMYKEYPDALALIGSYLGMLGTNSYAMQVYRNEISGIDGDIFGTVVKDGFDIVMDEFLSFLEISKEMGEQIRYDAVMKVVRDLYQDKGVTTEIIDEIETGFADVKTIYSTAEQGAKAVLIADLAKSSSALSYETIEEIVDSMLGENSAGIMKFLDAGTTIVDYIKATVQLYELDGELLIHLQKTVGENTQLYKDIDILLAEREQNPMAFFAKQFLSDAAKEAVSQALNSASGGLYSIVSDSGEALMGLVSEASVQEQAYAVYLVTYYSELGNVLDTIRQDFKNNADVYLESELAMRIEEYEFVLNAYKSSLGSFYDSAYAMASDGAKTVIQGEIDYLDSLTVEECISMCIKQMERLKERESETIAVTVQEKMDLLLEKLGVQNGSGVYFTVDQKACSTTRLSGHGCTNCNMSDIVKANWFTDLFGKINVNNFPSHDVDANRRDYSGQACFGFACFAQWYLYADSASENLKGERVAAVPFNKINMEKHVQPGDVVRVNGHSVLVYSLQEDGLMVIDSNWNISGQLNCLVQKHLLAYDNGNYANYTAYINRVTKTKTMEEGRAGVFDVSTNITGAPISTPVPTVTATPKPTCTPVPTAVPTQKPTATSAPTSEPTTTGWVKASECPAGVEIVETKWTYTYTDRTESEAAELAGWIREGERKEVVVSGSFDYAAFPDTFDTSHPVYTGMFTSKEAVPSTNGAVREIISDVPAGYVYWHYVYPIADKSINDRVVGYYRNQKIGTCYATEFAAFKSEKKYTTTVTNGAGGGMVYKVTDREYQALDLLGGSWWWYRFEYYKCTFQDIKTVYQYYRTINKESTTEVYEGNGNSNVVKWVRYK